MTNPLFSGCAMVCLFIAPAILSSQDRWQNLSQLNAGQKITVFDHQQESQSGKFLRYSETGLVIQVKGGEKKFDRDSISRITTPGAQNRKRNAFIGLLAGAAGGIGLVYAAGGNSELSAGDMVGGIGGTAAIGAGIGALWGKSSTIYRAERRKTADGVQQMGQLPVPSPSQ